jgi:hypothetical protein
MLPEAREYGSIKAIAGKPAAADAGLPLQAGLNSRF